MSETTQQMPQVNPSSIARFYGLPDVPGFDSNYIDAPNKNNIPTKKSTSRMINSIFGSSKIFRSSVPLDEKRLTNAAITIR
jgi:hypothetical protein